MCILYPLFLSSRNYNVSSSLIEVQNVSTVAVCLSSNYNLQAPLQKLSTNRKLVTKEDIKIQFPTKRSTTNTRADDSDKSSKKNPSNTKKPSETANSINLSNFVKVVPASKRWSDGTVSWASLPSSLSELGKV